MSDKMRDYVEWHKAYDDPDSGLSWRLRVVQSYLRDALDRHRGSLQIVSACSGDGRDLIGVLSGSGHRERVHATLIELHPDIAEKARRAALEAGLPNLEVRVADAGAADAYRGAVPADVVLLVGIFGNISDEDVERTIRAAPQFCATGATLIWSRGRQKDDRNDAIRGWFAESGFVELDYKARDSGSRPALGAVQYRGPLQALDTRARLFTFLQ